MIYINARFLTQSITGVQRFAIEISKELKDLMGDNIRFVSPPDILHKEIAKYLGKSEQEVLTLIDETSVYNVLSIEDDFNESFKIQLKDESIESSPEDLTVYNDTIKELQRTIGELNEREQLIINLYYYEGLTYKEIGEILNISESRVSQIHSKAISKMRKQFQH